jgi:hypothetical protein
MRKRPTHPQKLIDRLSIPNNKARITQMLTQNHPSISSAIRTETTHMGTQVFLGSTLLGTIDTGIIEAIDEYNDAVATGNDELAQMIHLNIQGLKRRREFWLKPTA